MKPEHPKERVILTVGHSTHAAEEFIELLRGQDIELLVDVRRYPGSRGVPWTNAVDLEQRLARGGIGYLHLESLGGRRSPQPGSRNDGWRVAQFQGYADHMRCEEFAGGLRTLEKEALRRRTAVMCAEAQWWRCHRRLLADALLVSGWHVHHLDGRGALNPHELTEFARLERGALRYPKQEALPESTPRGTRA